MQTVQKANLRNRSWHLNLYEQPSLLDIRDIILQKYFVATLDAEQLFACH